MNMQWEKLMNQLPKGDELTEKRKKTIHHLLPVPNDFKIEWAIIEELGHNPCGIVLTDKGIVIKGKTIKTIIEEEQSKGKKNRKTELARYQILLWESFDPNEISFSNNNGEISLLIGGVEYTGYRNRGIIDFIQLTKRKEKEFELELEQIILSATASNLYSTGFESIHFSAAYGADQSSTGHGIYAEEAGMILDRLSGEKSEVVGRDNAKNGPDKNVNGKAVQCKYCKSAYSSVRSCFKSNVNTGKKEFRYTTLDGKPMMVEVPKDQYVKAIEIMKEKIANGEVPGVTDVNEAYTIVRRGKLTYKQARNLAQAGTFESITYDTVTGAINCSFVFGITVLVSFGFAYMKNHDAKKSLKNAVAAGLETFGFSLASQVLSSQIAKAGIANSLKPATDVVVQKLGPKATQKIINALRTLVGKKAIYGAAASKSLSKALSSSILTSGVSILVFSVPHTYQVINKQISKGQYLKNVSNLIASTTGAVGTAIAAGVATANVGEKIGKKIDKKAGAAIGFIAGMGGGIAMGAASSRVGRLIREDDSDILFRLFNAVLVNVCADNFLNESEINDFIGILKDNKEAGKKIKKVMAKIYSSSTQYQDLVALLEEVLKPVLKKRLTISKDVEPDIDTFSDIVGETISNIAEEVE